MTTKNDMLNPRGTDYEHWKVPASQQPQREPHALRCETCGDLLECKPGEILYAATRRKGCASHSNTRPHTPAPEGLSDKAVDLLVKRVEEQATRTATLAENKRVLDKMAYWLKSNRCPPTKKKGDGCDGGCGMCMIESLRNTAAQEEK
jgi:hypothetical protein